MQEEYAVAAEATTTTAAPARTGPPRLGLILTACLVGQFMIVLDTTIVNIALPAISTALHFDRVGLLWVVNAYVVVVGGFLLLAGRIADIYGQRRTFLAGVVMFTAASAVGGLATNSTTLVLARGFQGLGGAVMGPATLTVLTHTFTEPAARAKAFGLWSAVSGGAGAFGVLAGGVITQWLSWRWILLVNVPIGIALFALALKVVPESRRPQAARALDVPGAVTVTGGLIGTIYAVSQSSTYGWSSARVVAPLAAGFVLLVAFVLIQAFFSKQPLVPLGFFRNRSVSVGNLVNMFGMAGLFSTFFFLTLILQDVFGYSPVRTGVLYLPISLALAAGGAGLSRLVPKFGPGPVLFAGFLVGAAGLFWLSRLNESSTFLGSILGPTIMIGIGAGAGMVAVTSAATAGLEYHEAGLASGLVNATRQIGISVGLVILVTVASARIRGDLVGVKPTGTAVKHALASGYGLALDGAALSALIAAVLALAAPRRKAAGRQDQPPAAH